MCQSLPRGVEADVKLLRAAKKVWPEEEEKKKGTLSKIKARSRKFKAAVQNKSRLFAESMDSGPFPNCKLSLRLRGNVDLKGKLRFPTFECLLCYESARCCGTMRYLNNL